MPSYKHIQIAPITGHIGAEISGVDLKNLNEEDLSEIHQAFLDHIVIFFRDQEMDILEYKAFASRFGPFGQEPFIKPMDGHPDVIEVLMEANEPNMINFGGKWHSDWSFQECPPLATILHAIDIPPYGGDTIFANSYLAYEALSEGMKQIIDPLVAIHSARRPFGTGKSTLGDTSNKSMTVVRSDDAYEEVEHPLVRVHPETGRKALYINPVYTIRLKGMSQRDSSEILGKLFRHATKEVFTCRFRWQKNSVAMWDNRCAMHLALNDYAGFRRELRRITIAGDRPFGTAIA